MEHPQDLFLWRLDSAKDAIQRIAAKARLSDVSSDSLFDTVWERLHAKDYPWSNPAASRSIIILTAKRIATDFGRKRARLPYHIPALEDDIPSAALSPERAFELKEMNRTLGEIVRDLPLHEQKLVNRYWDPNSRATPMKPVDRLRLSRLRHRMRNDTRLRPYQDWQPD